MVAYLSYLFLRLFICLIQTLRMETCARLASLLAMLAGDAFKIRGRIVDDNLRHAFPNLSDAARLHIRRRMWEHLILMVVEVAHAPRKIHETNWRDYISFRNADVLTRALLSERPLVVVSAHFGNFELAGFLLGLLGFPTYTVARTLDNPHLDKFVNRFRMVRGQHILPKQGAYDQIVRVLESGGKMAFLADQYAGSRGCWVEFFGQPASAHKAIALFSLSHDAPLAVAGATRLGRPLHYELWTLAIADPCEDEPHVAGVPQLTQWYTRHLESTIRQTPDQYWWLHRRWKDNRATKKKACAA